MHFDLPIQQLLRRKDTRFQFGFARQARDLVPARDEFVLAASREGLRVLGRNEDALRIPVEVLRDVYGPKLEVQPPEVRFAQAQEPIMHVRISVEARLLETVKALLQKRGAALQEEYVRPRYAVVRYEAPLADLLGLPDELSIATAGQARYWVVLSHYAPSNRTPGGDAA
jgi:predicted membrane GTPase involved in stress response